MQRRLGNALLNEWLPGTTHHLHPLVYGGVSLRQRTKDIIDAACKSARADRQVSDG